MTGPSQSALSPKLMKPDQPKNHRPSSDRPNRRGPASNGTRRKGSSFDKGDKKAGRPSHHTQRPDERFQDKTPQDDKPDLPDAFYSQDQLESATNLLTELEDKMKGLAARRGALDVLQRLRAGEPLDRALATTRTFSLLKGADRSFARNLVALTLRRRGSLDHVIGIYLDRPLPARAGEAMDILRMTGAQLYILGTPAHAAVATATELAGQKQELKGYKGLINAICRRLSEKGKKHWDALPMRTDTPGWLWRRWERQYGLPVARSIAEAHRGEPPLDLTLRDPQEAEKLAGQLGGVALANGTVRLSSGNITTMPGFDEGKFWAQDLAASLPVIAMGDVSGKVIYDVCAAPGGKTMQLAARGADVMAIDRSSSRLKTLHENMRRTKLRARSAAEDLLLWQPESQADGLLLDAPCSATGTLRRNPDIAWTRKDEDIEALAHLQTRMIDRAVTMVKPGGIFVYAVCSLQREEGEKQIEAALARHGNLRLIPITAEDLGGEVFAPLIAKQGWLRTLPCHLKDQGGVDGFFIAKMRVES